VIGRVVAGRPVIGRETVFEDLLLLVESSSFYQLSVCFQQPLDALVIFVFYLSTLLSIDRSVAIAEEEKK
jgi:hypothetical protein